MSLISQKEIDNWGKDELGYRYFPRNSRFGEDCSFGEACIIENNKELIKKNILSFCGFGSENRCTYFFKTKKGIYIRCGCWAGYLDDFKKKIIETHNCSKTTKEYLLMCDLAELRYRYEN